MRFAYIDSNGNEVPIPSVDALALRIELGAITENTQLYDAQADEWGPAHTHEIFHTLSRDAADDDGFVAPPPVASAPVADAPADAGTPQSAAPADGAAEGGEGSESAPVEGEAAPAPKDSAAVVEKQEEPAEEEDPSFGLTLADAPPAPPDDEGAGDDAAAAELQTGTAPAGSTEAEEPRRADEEDDLPYLELEPDAPDADDEEPLDLGPSSDTPDEESEAVFDFGDMEEALEVEESDEAEEPMDFSPASDGGTTDLGGGMELETAMEFDAADFDTGDDSSLDLETPMSEFSPAEPPSWMEEDDSAGGDEVLDFSSVGAGTEEEAERDAPAKERRTPRSRPSPPRHRRQRNLAVPLVGIVAILAVGIGGYVAWPVVSDRLASMGQPDDPEVIIPPLAEELMPVMRGAADAVLASIQDQARTDWAASSSVTEPPAGWLTGLYLATAGDYPAVEGFWTGISDYIGQMRSVDLGTFDAAMRAELEARGVPDADVAPIMARADSGFVAAAPDRAEVFDGFQGLADAALALHRFLVANQDNIEHAPAAAETTNPNLEVDPATEEIEAAMNDRLDAYFRAQAALGVRDKPTAAGLMSMLRDSAQDSWIR